MKFFRKKKNSIRSALSPSGVQGAWLPGCLGAQWASGYIVSWSGAAGGRGVVVLAAGLVY